MPCGWGPVFGVRAIPAAGALVTERRGVPGICRWRASCSGAGRAARGGERSVAAGSTGTVRDATRAIQPRLGAADVAAEREVVMVQQTLLRPLRQAAQHEQPRTAQARGQAGPVSHRKPPVRPPRSPRVRPTSGPLPLGRPCRRPRRPGPDERLLLCPQQPRHQVRPTGLCPADLCGVGYPSAAPVGARTIRCATSPRCRRTRPAGMSALHQRQGQGVQPSGQAVRADAEGRRQSECCRGGASRCPRQGRRSRAT